VCDRPALYRDVNEVLKLHGRSKNYGALPNAGGIFDQDDRVMELLDTVENAFAEVQQKNQRDRAAEIQRAEMMRGLDG